MTMKTSKPFVYPIAGVLDDTATIAPIENEPSPVRITPNRALHVNLRDNSGAELSSFSIGSVIPGFGPTNLGKREDDPHTSLDVGVMSLGVRADTLSAKASTNGDYEPIPVASLSSLVGVPVHIVGDDDKYVRGVVGVDAAVVGGPIMSGGIGHTTTPTAVTSGNTVIGLHDTAGRYRITGDSSMSPIMVGVSAATSIATNEDVGSANADTMVKVAAIRRDTPVANDNVSTDGDYTQLKLDNTGKLWIAGSQKEDDPHGTGDRGVFVLAVANSDTAPTTYAAAQDYTPQAVNTDGSNWVVGNRAHDTVDAGGPVKVGGMASSSRPTAVASADRVNAYYDVNGIQNVKTDSYNRSDTFTAVANGTTVDVTVNPLKYFSIQVVQTGVVTAWDVRLEASIDGTNFSQVIAHTNADGSGIVKASVVFPARYFRARCSGLTLGVGTNVIATILGVS